MVAVIGATVVFKVVKAAMFPTPLAARPMVLTLFVQLYTIVPPVVGLEKATAVDAAPTQITWLVMALTAALGFTVMVKLSGVPAQLTPALV